MVAYDRLGPWGRGGFFGVGQVQQFARGFEQVGAAVAASLAQMDTGLVDQLVGQGMRQVFQHLFRVLAAGQLLAGLV